MINTIGIRKETKDQTQRRAPLAPQHVEALIQEHGLRVLVEPCDYRVFPDETYRSAGAIVTPQLAEANLVFGVKEVAPQYQIDDTGFCFFSHTIKSQLYNMPMLASLLRRRVTLFDYELIRDNEGRRLVFFGNYAGYAGMIDAFWALGRRLTHEGTASPFAAIRYASDYASLADAEAAVAAVGTAIERDGLPDHLVPFLTAFTGYGNVSQGAQTIYDKLPVEIVSPRDLGTFLEQATWSKHRVYKVVFHESDMYRHRFEPGMFNLQEFYHHPDRYESQFDACLPHVAIIVNGIYWDQRYPRLVTKDGLRALFSPDRRPPLRVIADISCDVEGSIEATLKQTHAENPVFVYDVATGEARDGVDGLGPVILAVDQLPTELPREASIAFGDMLMPFVPEMAAVDLRLPLDELALSDPIRNAIIAHRGELTPSYAYLREALAGVRDTR
jgi:alpha-aminoadipic semialdehyde synthase